MTRRTPLPMSWFDAHYHAIHRWARTAIMVFAAVMTVVLTYLDYGYDYSVFYNLGYDPTGWLHEIFYLWAFALAFMAISVLWEVLITLHELLRVIVKRMRLGGP